MSRTRIHHVLVVAVCASSIIGFAAEPTAPLKQHAGESVVFIGEEPAALAWLPAPGTSLRVRSTYLPAAGTVEYVEGRDFVVDYPNGLLRRTPESRIPDFRKN